MEHTSGRFDSTVTSCLTCRHRCKKYDKARPACEECTAGGFVCLSYDPHTGVSTSLSPDESPNESKNVIKEPTSRAAQSENTSSSTDSSETLSAVSQDSPFASTSMTSSVSLGSDSPACLERDSPFLHVKYGLLASMGYHSASVDHGPSSVARTQTSSSLATDKATTGRREYFSHTSSVADAWQPPGASVYQPGLHPQNFAAIPKDIGRIVYFILPRFEQVTDKSYVRPSYAHFARYRDHVKWHLQTSSNISTPTLFGCKIVDSFLDGTGKQKQAYYNRCIAKAEQHLRSGLDRSLTAVESYGLHSGMLEMAFIKSMRVNGISTYRLLQDAAPNFVQVASAGTPLCTTPSGRTSVSLAHALASTQLQLARFVLSDSVYSMVYTLPLVVEYNTSTPPIPSDLNATEWVHGCSLEFQFAFVEINQRCNSLKRVGPETDWRSIEHRIRTWQPKARAAPDKHSWKSVVRLAIQESWRHALLIYLYMAVGGVASDDVRVCACVQQVFKLAGVVENLETYPTSAPVYVQYLIAGICTPYENQRAKAAVRLSSRSDLSALWLLHGYELVPVLSHLWRGVAANGRAIRWCDYVHSRQIVLPHSRF